MGQCALYIVHCAMQNTAATVATYCIVKMVGWMYILHSAMQNTVVHAVHCRAGWMDQWHCTLCIVQCSSYVLHCKDGWMDQFSVCTVYCVMQFSQCNAEHCIALQSWLDGSVAGKTADNCIQFNCPAIYTIFTIFSAKIIHIYNIICKYLSYLQYLQISLIFTIFKRSLILSTSSANIINIYKIIFNNY